MTCALDGIATIRRSFPGTAQRLYFDTAAHALLPAGAREAVSRYMDDCVNEGGAPATMRATLDRVRGKFARLINADVDEIAVVKNVSEGINAIATSLPWRPGQNAILCAEVEHPNALYALYNLRDRHGIEVCSVAATADHAISIDAIASALDAQTRLVIASSVAYTTGARNDLGALARHCRERDVLLLIDGAQSVGALELNVRNTPIDAMAVGASKFLCGPPGIGFLYVRRNRAERMQPAGLARYGVDLGTAHEGETGGSAYKLMPAARRFEQGSYNYAGANAIEVSLDLIGGVTVPVIEQHVLALARKFTDGLLNLGLPVMSGQVARHFSHIVVVGRRESDAVMQARLMDLHAFLQAKNVKLSIRHGRLRFAFHFYNTEDEVAAVLSLLRTFWLGAGKTGGAAVSD